MAYYLNSRNYNGTYISSQNETIESSQTSNQNYILFDGLTGNKITINSLNNRERIAGIQIIKNSV